MKLYKIRGGNEEELRVKAYTIAVPISLGNKWFSPENILGLIEWSLEYTREYIVVYVADSIHAINIEVRNRKRSEKAREIALKMGDEILQKTRELAESKLSSTQLAKIHYAKWDELLTREYQTKLDFLRKKYQDDSNFRDTIIKFINDFTGEENKNFSSEDKLKLGTYLVEELPELLCRVPIQNLPFDGNAYPYDSEFLAVVEKIQEGDLFPEIKQNIINTPPKVFLEVRE